MHCVARVAAWMTVAIGVAGCNALEGQYLRQGIGTDLGSMDVATATELQNVYLDHLCRQTLPFVGAGVPSCSQEQVPPNAWPLIVQAGMNDIDQRCDAYLAWLDQKKRQNSAILAEISAIRSATDAILNPTITHGVGPRTLAAVAAAFGLATDTFNNVNSLLLQVDHTTVQAVVFGRRKDYRKDIAGAVIDNKPSAIHALRSYLTICMPMTIATDINLTATVYQQGGAGALDARPLVDAATVPLRARDVAGTRPERPKFKGDPTFEKIFKGYTPNNFPIDVIKNLQDILCVPVREAGIVGETTAHHIAIFEETKTDIRPEDQKRITRDGKIDVVERDLLLRDEACPRNAAQNYYERIVFMNGRMTDIKWVIQLLNKEKLPGVQDLPEDTTLNGARTRIAQVRQSLSSKPALAKGLKKRPESMAGQWTKDLFDVLAKP